MRFIHFHLSLSSYCYYYRLMKLMLMTIIFNVYTYVNMNEFINTWYIQNIMRISSWIKIHWYNDNNRIGGNGKSQVICTSFVELIEQVCFAFICYFFYFKYIMIIWVILWMKLSVKEEEPWEIDEKYFICKNIKK